MAFQRSKSIFDVINLIKIWLSRHNLIIIIFIFTYSVRIIFKSIKQKKYIYENMQMEKCWQPIDATQIGILYKTKWRTRSRLLSTSTRSSWSGTAGSAKATCSSATSTRILLRTSTQPSGPSSQRSTSSSITESESSCSCGTPPAQKSTKLLPRLTTEGLLVLF